MEQALCSGINGNQAILDITTSRCTKHKKNELVDADRQCVPIRFLKLVNPPNAWRMPGIALLRSRSEALLSVWDCHVLRHFRIRRSQVGEKVEFDDVPESAETVNHADLLAFLVSAAIVADRHFVNRAFQFRYLGRDLNLEAKSPGSDSHDADNFSAKRLVSGLNVCDVQVSEEVREKGQ